VSLLKRKSAVYRGIRNGRSVPRSSACIRWNPPERWHEWLSEPWRALRTSSSADALPIAEGESGEDGQEDEDAACDRERDERAHREVEALPERSVSISHVCLPSGNGRLSIPLAVDRKFGPGLEAFSP
jgi:hypothetical protein